MQSCKPSCRMSPCPHVMMLIEQAPRHGEVAENVSLGAGIGAAEAECRGGGIADSNSPAGALSGAGGGDGSGALASCGSPVPSADAAGRLSQPCIRGPLPPGLSVWDPPVLPVRLLPFNKTANSPRAALRARGPLESIMFPLDCRGLCCIPGFFLGSSCLVLTAMWPCTWPMRLE